MCLPPCPAGMVSGPSLSSCIFSWCLSHGSYMERPLVFRYLKIGCVWSLLLLPISLPSETSGGVWVWSLDVLWGWEVTWMLVCALTGEQPLWVTGEWLVHWFILECSRFQFLIVPPYVQTRLERREVEGRGRPGRQSQQGCGWMWGGQGLQSHHCDRRLREPEPLFTALCKVNNLLSRLP